MNCPEAWARPMPPPDLIRAATGIVARNRDRALPGQAHVRSGNRAGDGRDPRRPGRGARPPRVRRLGAEASALVASPPYLGRVFVLPAVPPADLVEWTASADVMVMAIQPTSVNHQFTTPQKLFEAIAAGVPVVASDLPGMATIVTSHRRARYAIRRHRRPSRRGPGASSSSPRTRRAALRARVLAVGHEQLQLGPPSSGRCSTLYRELAPAPDKPRDGGRPA